MIFLELRLPHWRSCVLVQAWCVAESCLSCCTRRPHMDGEEVVRGATGGLIDKDRYTHLHSLCTCTPSTCYRHPKPRAPSQLVTHNNTTIHIITRNDTRAMLYTHMTTPFYTLYAQYPCPILPTVHWQSITQKSQTNHTLSCIAPHCVMAPRRITLYTQPHS